LATVFGAVLFGAFLFGAFLFEAGFEGAAFAAPFAAEDFAFAAVLADLLGIALLLFLEDLGADALAAVRGSFREARARLLVALRPAAVAFLDTFEALFLRVFCDTACARNSHAPVR
jgi:hypothetical protein